MANSKKRAVYTGVTAKGEISASSKIPASTNLTDGYQILDRISINNKIPFEELLKIITDSILESIGKSHVKNIYLFGSHAYGKPNKYSDIDLCVVIADRINKSKAYLNISRVLNNKIIVSIDMLIYHEREYNDRKDHAGIVKTIFTKGRMLYG
jgi:predicted nucleotidyltransferase